MPRAGRKTLLVTGGSLAAVLAGCQLLTGASERDLVTGDETCRLSSDCVANGICLFGFCSPECRADRDCARGSRCLKTALEAACVRPDRANCAAQPCPEGTLCVENECRTLCNPTTLPCLDGQACVGSVCISGGAPDAGVACPALQTDRDCKKQVCDGSGAVSSEPDPADLPADGNDCTKDICTGSVPSNPNEDDGMPCLGGTCSSGICSGPCKNRRRDGKETGIDCGGGECPKCDDAEGCRSSSDCAAGICTSCLAADVCNPCLSECTPAMCGEPPITVSGSCFTVVLLRNGAVVEAQSSPELCESSSRTVWKRGADVIYIYSESPPEHAVHVFGSHPAYFPIEWFSRCAPKLSSREELLAELNASSNWVRYPEPIGPIIDPRMNCPSAALYKW